MTKAYGYIRVSNLDSFKKDVGSMQAQKLRVESYYDQQIKAKAGWETVEWGGCEDDGTNVSAYKTPFHLRPAGKRLVDKLEKGDHLIVDRVDRFWRSMADFVNMMEQFNNKGVTVHIVSFLGQSLTNTTPMGSFLLKIFVLLAELESDIKAERSQESADLSRRMALSRNNIVPTGCVGKPFDFNGKKRTSLHWSRFRRRIMGKMVQLRANGWFLTEHKEILYKFAVEAIQYEIDCDPEYDPTDDKEWIRTLLEKFGTPAGESRYSDIYKTELAYRHLGISQIHQLPKQKFMLEAKRSAILTARRARNPAGDYDEPTPAADILARSGVLENGFTKEELEAGIMVTSDQYWSLVRNDFGYIPGHEGE